jgi:hypothetical protein
MLVIIPARYLGDGGHDLASLARAMLSGHTVPLPGSATSDCRTTAAQSGCSGCRGR